MPGNERNTKKKPPKQARTQRQAGENRTGNVGFRAVHPPAKGNNHGGLSSWLFLKLNGIEVTTVGDRPPSSCFPPGFLFFQTPVALVLVLAVQTNGAKILGTATPKHSGTVGTASHRIGFVSPFQKGRGFAGHPDRIILPTVSRTSDCSGASFRQEKVVLAGCFPAVVQPKTAIDHCYQSIL